MVVLVFHREDVSWADRNTPVVAAIASRELVPFVICTLEEVHADLAQLRVRAVLIRLAGGCPRTVVDLLVEGNKVVEGDISILVFL